MDYEVIDGFSAQEITKKVKEKLVKGWQLYGELKIISYEAHDDRTSRDYAKVLFAQAVIFEEQHKPSRFKSS